jgi:hypothetical protein
MPDAGIMSAAAARENSLLAIENGRTAGGASLRPRFRIN